LNKNGDAGAFTRVAAVSGFGAYTILLPENGLHVLEEHKKERRPPRRNVRVRVVSQPDEPVGNDPRRELEQAVEALRSCPEELTNVVRKYRSTPSPLIRDSVRNWRTGKWDLVLGGDFDLIGK